MVKEIRILIYILILSNAGHAFAYFQVHRQSENLRVEHTTNQTSTQDNNTYLIYDNLFSNDSESFLVRNRDDFIYFDKIDVDIPLRLLKKNLIFENDSVDRMMASNLRIKNLLNQYRGLNSRQRTLQQRANLSTTQSPGHNDPSFQQSAEQIEQQRRRIETILKNVRQYDISSAISRTNRDVIVLDSFENMAGQPGEVTGYDNYIAGRTGEIAQGPSGLESPYRQKQVVNRGTENLPWIFTVALKVINYIMNNRIEIIVYTMFVILAGFLISLKAQK